MSPLNVPREEAFFQSYGLHILMVIRYLGGFMGTKEAHDCCLGKKVECWWYLVATLARVARQHPHTAYEGMHKSLYQ